MTHRYRRIPPSASFPLYRVDETRANRAYEAYSALRKATQTDPSLLENQFYLDLIEQAYGQFLASFEKLR